MNKSGVFVHRIAMHIYHSYNVASPHVMPDLAETQCFELRLHFEAPTVTRPLIGRLASEGTITSRLTGLILYMSSWFERALRRLAVFYPALRT